EDIKIKNPNTTERFMMCLAVNPNAPGWILDFKRCIKEANALRVYPNYHGYNLEDQRFYDLVEIAASHDLPIIVTVRIQDERSHPWFLKMSPVNVTDILRVSKRYPETQFIISNAYLNEVLPSKKEIVRLENVYVELSFISSVTLNSIEMLSAEIGADRMVLGTYMPFFYPECAINRVKKSELSTEEKEFILWKNAAKLLKIN
ncbi:TPA: hypothetical protein EYP70_04700, partial [Candidatus Bathyarchaeota archaeon]|nr:hypothetical protein [Candidatus Bathyarchaeota archaeon]